MNLTTVSDAMGNFFPAMGTPLLQRGISAKDDLAGKILVVIVNSKIAQHFWPNRGPVGKRMHLDMPEMQTPWMTVVGKVAVVRLATAAQPSREHYYLPVA
jgi:hypothetical protein